MLKIFVNTWGNYNENGADGGEWLSLPMDEEELKKELERIAEAMGDDDPEWAIHDYEWTDEEFTEISEYSNIIELNSLCAEIDALDDYERETLAAYMEAEGGSIRDALENYGDCVYYSGMTLTDVAEELVAECYELPEIAQRYFDYEAFARDLSYDGYCETENGVICVA